MILEIMNGFGVWGGGSVLGEDDEDAIRWGIKRKPEEGSTEEGGNHLSSDYHVRDN